MKKIDISTPKHPNIYTLVDDNNFDWLNQWKWHTFKDHNGGYVVARNCQCLFGEKRHMVLMHRQIMSCPQGKEVDHVNHNFFDNRKKYLRICTHAENKRNGNKHKNNTSGFKGVCWNENEKNWRAQIIIDGKYRWLGRFNSKIKAALAYDKAAKKYHGKFACLNFK